MWSPAAPPEPKGPEPARDPPAAAAARPATPLPEGEARVYGQKRKTPEQEPSTPKDQLQLCQDWADLLDLTMSKLPLLYNNYYKRALLRCTLLRYWEMQDEEEAAQGMSQGAPSSQQRSWEDLPQSSHGAGTTSSVETGKEPPSRTDAWQPTAFGAGDHCDPTSIVSGQFGGEGAHDGSLVLQPSPSALEETYSRADLLADPGEDSHPGTEEPASPKADARLSALSEDPAPSILEEATFLDSLSQEDPFSSVLFGTFDILAANYLSEGIPSGDLFADIDISEFETTPAPLPSGGQSPLVNAEQEPCEEPQEEALPLPTQGANERGDWGHFVE